MVENEDETHVSRADTKRRVEAKKNSRRVIGNHVLMCINIFLFANLESGN